MTDALDFAIRFADPGHGLQSVADACLDPAEIAMRAEEAEPVERAMVVARLLAFLLCNTLCPGDWARRFFALARWAHPSLVREVDGEAWERGCRVLSAKAGPGVAALLARCEHGVSVAQGLGGGSVSMAAVVPADAGEEWFGVLESLLEDFSRGGLRPEPVAKHAGAIAMALYPSLLVRATCAEHAALFAEVRAAVSWRVREVFNRRVEAAGGVAHAAFQKSASVVRKYKAAQMGNENRRQRRRRKRAV